MLLELEAVVEGVSSEDGVGKTDDDDEDDDDEDDDDDEEDVGGITILLDVPTDDEGRVAAAAITSKELSALLASMTSSCFV